MKESEEYRALPRMVSQLDQNRQSFFAAIQDWRDHREPYLGRPKLPGYKPKQAGQFLLI
jgi:putative transposase